MVSTQYRDLRAGTKETWASVHDDGSARPANMWESRNTKFGSASNGSASPCSLKTVDNSGCPYDDGSIPLPAFSPVTSSLTMQTDPVNFRSQIRELATDVVNQGGIQFLQAIAADG